jgi:hypothetical protein
MEAALKDFEEWMKTITVQQVTYYAVFDPSSGQILGVYPNHSCPDTTSKILIDDDTAQLILEGKTNLNSYAVDITDGSLEIIETKSLTKIDDVLHRIVDQRWTEISDVDVHLSSDVRSNKLTISLSEKFYRSKKILWNGSTEMLFLITDYNDPNRLHDRIAVTVDQLFESKSLDYVVDFPKEFSIYTKRIFKNYVIKHENS